jgi:hypothetical protein
MAAITFQPAPVARLGYSLQAATQLKNAELTAKPGIGVSAE